MRGAIVLLAGLAFPASADAAPPEVARVAPFRVTLAAVATVVVHL